MLFIWKSNIHICCPCMSLYGYILVLYYVRYAINFNKKTFYFNFTATFTSYIVITFTFSYHYTFTTSWLRQKTLFLLLIIQLISPLRLLRQDLEKLHIFLSLVLLRSLQRDSDKKSYFAFHHFYCSTLSTSSTTFTMSWSREK